MKKIRNNKDFQKIVKDKNFVVTFIKKSTGEERVMNATLNFQYITENSNWKPTGKDIPTPDNIVKLWDIDKQAWRSLDVNTIINLEVKD